jgi:hypothetical protein
MATETKQPAPSKIGLQEAIAAAERYFRELYHSTSISNLLLEEVEEKDGKWLITLGFDTERLVHGPLGSLLLEPMRQELIRVYKTFVVDSKSGTVRAMKMHPPLPV